MIIEPLNDTNALKPLIIEPLLENPIAPVEEL